MMNTSNDYSDDWVSTLQKLHSFDIKQLEKLYQVLAKCKSRDAPNKPPVVREGQDDNDNVSVVSEISITTGSITTGKSKSIRTQGKTSSSFGVLSSNASINSFAALDDDSDDEIANGIIQDIQNTHLDDRAHLLSVTTINKPVIQTRYIRVKILCAIVDCHRKDA